MVLVTSVHSFTRMYIITPIQICFETPRTETKAIRRLKINNISII